MKRILAILLLASTMLVMASCGSSGPERTVEKYVEALLEFDLDKASKYTAVDYEDIFDAKIAWMMQSEEISEDEALEKFSESIGADSKIESYDDYVDYLMKKSEEAFKEEMDGEYEIEVYAVASEILEENEKYSAIKSASKKYDENKVVLADEINVAKIKECRNVTVKIYFYLDGSDVFTTVNTIEVCAAKVGSSWVILDGGMGMDN